MEPFDVVGEGWVCAFMLIKMEGLFSATGEEDDGLFWMVGKEGHFLGQDSPITPWRKACTFSSLRLLRFAYLDLLSFSYYLLHALCPYTAISSSPVGLLFPVSFDPGGKPRMIVVEFVGLHEYALKQRCAIYRLLLTEGREVVCAEQCRKSHYERIWQALPPNIVRNHYLALYAIKEVSPCLSQNKVRGIKNSNNFGNTGDTKVFSIHLYFSNSDSTTFQLTADGILSLW